jgi:hypothetical protein
MTLPPRSAPERLIGYVSDERDVALAGVDIALEAPDGHQLTMRSTATGSIRVDCPAGPYRITLSKDGYGAKHVDVVLPAPAPYRFRLLSDGLAVYPWPKWCRVGDAVSAHVHSMQPYSLTLWRYGLEKRLVKDFGWFGNHGPEVLRQITPDGDYTQEGVRWGTVGYDDPLFGDGLAVPPPGGLLFLHVETASGGFISSPLIVAPSEPTARVAVLASTNTWNAYNEFGGRSNYVNTSGLLGRPTVNARQDLPQFVRAGVHVEWEPPDSEYPPLSFERPDPDNHIERGAAVTDSMPGFISSSMAALEWRLHAWLEREGFAFDVYADAQLHSGMLDLEAYDVLVIVGHPEYWSKAMFLRVSEWIAAGGRLLSLGGNAIDCEVVFDDDSTLRCLTQTGVQGHVTHELNPGHPFESRFQRTTGHSGGELLGSVLTYAGFGTAAPYAVVEPDHWAFAGTDLQPGDEFGGSSLCQRCPGASGWETDERRDSTPSGTLLLARGTNDGDGGADMLYRETPAGGAVFSVGSITYAASLLVDHKLSVVTANVLSRFLNSE